MSDDLDLPDELYGFGSWLLWLVATRAPVIVDRAYAAGPARPSRRYGTVDGHPVPTPSLVAWLLMAAEHGIPVDKLGDRRTEQLNKQQRVLRTTVSRAVGGEPRLFKDPWLRELADVCGLGEHEVQLLSSSRDLGGIPVDPGMLRAAIAATRKADQDAGASQGRSGQPALAEKPVRLEPRPRFLVGRDALLAELAARLSARDERAGPRIVALCGLGGAGKSSLALEYAHRQLAGSQLVWQFPAENQTALAAGFGVLAAQLHEQGVPAGDPVGAVHAVLAAMQEPWLLIFDNAPDAASIRTMLPPAGLGQVLITSQNPNWSICHAIEVPVLSQDVAATFLIARTGDRDLVAATELAGELDGLPLALEQACAYMRATGRPVASYLALFRERRTDLLDYGEAGDHGKPVTATLALTIEQLQKEAPQEAPSAIGLLQLLACCAPERIPVRLLLTCPPGTPRSLGPAVAPLVNPMLADPVAADRAIAALRRYSLISAPAEGTVSVHRLVQAVTLAHVPAEQARSWPEAARSLIEAALPADPEQPGTWPDFALLLPHAQVALATDGEPMARIAEYLGHSGNYVAACALYRRIVSARERATAAGEPGLLSARASLAHWTGEAGNPAAARDQLALLLPDCELVLGADHPGTLTARASLATWTGESGDPGAARDQYAALVPDRKRVLGPDHPDTLTSRANLAYWTGQSGDPHAARDLYAALVPDREHVLGPDHPDALTSRANLARCTGEAGDPAGARDQLAALVPDRERVLGADHPDTLTSRASLAYWTDEAARPPSAP